MAISINWDTKVITVWKSDLTLVQSSPSEIYELPLNSFRLNLKALEASEEGMIFEDTHTHNTEVNLGGLTFARVIQIINDYTVTFEDGMYAVNLVGANSNVADVINVNQVSVRSQNSAGLISTPLIEFSSFEGGVWFDPTNETGKAVSGTIFPAGTRLTPSLLLIDVKQIAAYRGLNVVYVIGDCTIDSGLDFTRYVFEGQSHVNNTATIASAADVTNAVFRNLTITGILDGGNEVTNSVIEDLEYVNGQIHNCGLIGDITLAGSADAIMINCNTIDPYDPPVIDCGGSGQNLIMPSYSGLVTVKNVNGSGVFVGIGLSAGVVTLDSNTISDGTFHISGVGQVVDENGDFIPTGEWNGATIINQTTEYSLDFIKKITGNKVTKAGDIITIYEDDGTTTWKTYNLANGGRVET
jgi:hypothetical protein